MKILVTCGGSAVALATVAACSAGSRRHLEA